MKKFLVVLLSLGLIVAFSATASAVDVKFSGGYYVVGVYDNNPNLKNSDYYSRAAFFQRARVQSDFQVAEGLSMTVRFDALEKQWGQTDYRSITAADQDKTNSRVYKANTTAKVQENLELERGFITANTGIGQFIVGYQAADQWGTKFGDSECTRPRVKYVTKMGPLTMLAVYEKVFEGDTSVVANYAGKVDVDADNYFLAGIYSFKGGEAGLLYKNIYDARNRVAAVPYKTKVNAFVPYFKVTVGPVYVEGEAAYAFGKAAEMETAGVQDVDMQGWNAYIMAKMTMGPAYFGGQFAYVSGNDPDDASKSKTGPDGGYDYKPTLVLNNVDYNTWIPGTDSGNTYKNDAKGYMLYNVFGGFNPTPKLNIEAAISVVSYATKKVTKTTELVSDKIGTEIDLTATYKIFDNLSYMVGGAYIITGDAWRGVTATPANEVGNNYMLLNKLTLNF